MAYSRDSGSYQLINSVKLFEVYVPVLYLYSIGLNFIQDFLGGLFVLSDMRHYHEI